MQFRTSCVRERERPAKLLAIPVPERMMDIEQEYEDKTSEKKHL